MQGRGWLLALALGLAASSRGQAVLEASLGGAAVPPGNVAVCRVRGLAPQGLTLAGFRQEAGFYYSRSDDALVALLAVPLGTRSGRKRLELRWPGAEPQVLWLTVKREASRRQRVRVAGLKSKMKRAVRSGDREVLDQAVAKADEGPPQWRGRFQWPVEGEPVVTPPFGARRAYNRGPAAWRHKGLDLPAAEGTPGLAAKHGNVPPARRPALGAGARQAGTLGADVVGQRPDPEIIAPWPESALMPVKRPLDVAGEASARRLPRSRRMPASRPDPKPLAGGFGSRPRMGRLPAAARRR